MNSNFCNNCGNPLNANDKFCQKCGNAVVISNLQQPVSSTVTSTMPTNMAVQQANLVVQQVNTVIPETNTVVEQTYTTPTSPNIKQDFSMLTSSYKYAGFGTRLGAYLLDSLVTTGIGFLIFILPIIIGLIIKLTINPANMDGINFIFSVLQYFASVIITMFGLIIYRGVKDGSEKRTIGRRASNSRVIYETGNNISTGTSFGRQVVGAIINYTVIGLIVNTIFMLSDDRHQTLVDKIFKTCVIKTN